MPSFNHNLSELTVLRLLKPALHDIKTKTAHAQHDKDFDRGVEASLRHSTIPKSDFTRQSPSGTAFKTNLSEQCSFATTLNEQQPSRTASSIFLWKPSFLQRLDLTTWEEDDTNLASYVVESRQSMFFGPDNSIDQYSEWPSLSPNSTATQTPSVLTTTMTATLVTQAVATTVTAEPGTVSLLTTAASKTTTSAPATATNTPWLCHCGWF